MKKILPIVTALFLFIGTYMTFYYAVPLKGLQETYYILFWHVPFNWVATVLIGCSAFWGFKYIKTNMVDYALKSYAVNCVGFIFCLYGNLSGMAWGQLQWGGIGIENLDPKFLSAVFSLFIYSSYFIFRNSISEEDAKFRLSSVYSMISFPFLIFFSFVLPRLKFSLHPNNPIFQMKKKVVEGKVETSSSFGAENGITMLVTILAVTCVSVLIYKLRYRMEKVQYKLEEELYG